MPSYCEFVSAQFLGFTMPFCPLGTLHDFLQARATCAVPRYFAESLIWDILQQVASALTSLHELGFAHGDLKPSNIIMQRDLQVLLSDFGSAVRLGDKKSCRRHTLAYKAPEAFREASAAGATPSDMWSLGCIAYELCTLQHPFIDRPHSSASCAPRAKEVAQSIRNQTPRSIGDRVSAGLRAAVFSLLEKDPDRRLTALELLHIVPPETVKRRGTSLDSPSRLKSESPLSVGSCSPALVPLIAADCPALQGTAAAFSSITKTKRTIQPASRPAYVRPITRAGLSPSAKEQGGSVSCFTKHEMRGGRPRAASETTPRVSRLRSASDLDRTHRGPITLSILRQASKLARGKSVGFM